MKKHFIFILMMISPFCVKSQEMFEKANANNKFSIGLYKQLVSEKENLIFSPLSIKLALSLAYEGAEGKTKNEFEKVLHIDSNTKGSSLMSLSDNLTKYKDQPFVLNISNAIWIQDNLKIKDTYQDIIRAKYASDIFPVDFSNSSSAALKINNWVSEKTNRLIPSIIEPEEISPSTKLVISNAVYFMAKWKSAFDKALTKKDDFYAIDKTKASLDFLNKEEFLKYFENDDFQCVFKEYEGWKSFCVILPKNEYGIADVERGLNELTLKNSYFSAKYAKVKLSIPKLKLATDLQLNEPLKKLGLNIAFTSEADFKGITTKEPLFISKVTHKACIDVDEEKTTAAAATAMMMIGGVVPPENKVFKADHPFIFMVIDKRTQEILFMGRYVKPE